jgi:hypothetical protein
MSSVRDLSISGQHARGHRKRHAHVLAYRLRIFHEPASTQARVSSTRIFVCVFIISFGVYA